MRLTIDLTLEDVKSLLTQSRYFAALFTHLENRIMGTIADVQAAVEAQTTVVGSTVTLLDGIKAKLDEAIAAGADPNTLQALSDQIGVNTKALSEAVARDTVASAEVPTA